MGASFLPASTSLNEEGLTVKKSIYWLDWTLESALPAYVGLMNVLLSLFMHMYTNIYVISLMGCASYFPANLGITSLP